MAEQGHGGLNPGSFLEAVFTAAAQKTLTSESALRLIFLSRKAGDKGYAWWTRAKLAAHWEVHKTTITRDYEQWAERGLVKLRPNPLKASAKLIIFPWSKVWDDAVWEDPEKVASMLADLCEAFDRKSREGRMRATQKGRTDATLSAGSPLSENQKGKELQAAGSNINYDSNRAIPRKPPGDPGRQGDRPQESPGLTGVQHDETTDGFREMQALLARNRVNVQPGQIRDLIQAGGAQGLTLEGVFAFVEDKLKQKRDQQDPVYSATLLVNAINDDVDLHRWAATRQRCSLFFEQRNRAAESPFSVHDLKAHLSSGAKALRALPEYNGITTDLDLLIADIDVQFRNLEALDQSLTGLEERIAVIALAEKSQSELAQAKRDLDSQLRPYREKMTGEQLARLERKYIERWLFESNDLPRLRLFYLTSSEVAA